MTASAVKLVQVTPAPAEPGEGIPWLRAPRRLSSARDCKVELSRIYRAAISGRLPWPVATRATFVLMAMVRAIEVAELEERVGQLERAVDRR